MADQTGAERARAARVRVWELTDLMLQGKARDAEALLSVVPEDEMRALVSAAVANLAVAMGKVFPGGMARDMVRQSLRAEGVGDHD